MGGITLADRNAQGIAATERLIKDVNPKMDVLKVLVNVADQKSVENMVSETVARFGGINYGMFFFVSIEYFKDNFWR